MRTQLLTMADMVNLLFPLPQSKGRAAEGGPTSLPFKLACVKSLRVSGSVGPVAGADNDP